MDNKWIVTTLEKVASGKITDPIDTLDTIIKYIKEHNKADFCDHKNTIEIRVPRGMGRRHDVVLACTYCGTHIKILKHVR